MSSKRRMLSGQSAAACQCCCVGQGGPNLTVLQQSVHSVDSEMFRYVIMKYNIVTCNTRR